MSQYSHDPLLKKIIAKSSKPKMKMDDADAARNMASAKSWLSQALESVDNAAASENDYRIFAMALQQIKYAQEALKSLSDHYHPDARSVAEAVAEPLPMTEPDAPLPDAENPSYDVPSELAEAPEAKMPEGASAGDLFHA